MVDSDFDIDENDEPVSDQETDDKQKRKVGTKAYKVCWNSFLGLARLNR